MPLALPLDPDLVPQGPCASRSILTSLPGQDALRYFDLELSYNPPSLTPTETMPA